MNSHPVRSRDHLLHMLAEAAELEHNLLCSYLYAAFSLKQPGDSDLTEAQAAAVGRWRAAILGVCMEEMGHLAQVANLMIAVGSRPHFDRPNLPVAPGYHPAQIQVALRRFDRETLTHFIFLERPLDAPLTDAPAFEAPDDSPRRGEFGVLMPSAPQYQTIGEFYQLLQSGLVSLSAALGERELFVGPAEHQMRADEIGIDELSVVRDLGSATRAIELIVAQGEGSPSVGAHSHFEEFQRVQREYEDLLAESPDFEPSRPVAEHPVMRAPMAPDRVHVNAPVAAPLLDAANATYSVMLRCLAAVYDTPWSQAERRRTLLGAAVALMQLLRALSDELTAVPAQVGSRVHGGVSFTMLRSTEGIAPGVDAQRLIRERLLDIARQLPTLDVAPDRAARLRAQVDGLIADLTA